MARREAGTGMQGARIHIAEWLEEGEDTPTNDQIGAAVGSKRSNVSLIARTSLQRLQLRVVTEHVFAEMAKRPDYEIVNAIVYVVENRLGWALVDGDLSVDHVLGMMGSKAA